MLAPNLDRHLAAFRDGAEELLPEEELVRKLERALASGRGLRIKQGFDPTAPDIHLGHTIGLRKLRQLQDLGHTVVVIVGDYTGLVGDPSGCSKTRPQLELAEIEANAKTYLEQFFSIVDRASTEVRHNGEWFAPMRFADLLKLTSRYTVARLLERDDFAKRMRANQPISVHELLYPLMQGWDSVEVRADVELGGTEQKFNLLVGRAMQEAVEMEPQVILTLPILVGLDGQQRMSKSLGNYVGVAEPAGEQFGKIMSIPDSLLESYWRLVSGADAGEVKTVLARLQAHELHPMEAKKMLAERVAATYHGAEAAKQARGSFERQFSRGGLPSEAFEWRLPVSPEDAHLPLRSLLVSCGLAKSTSEAWRKVEEGAVELDGEVLRDPKISVALAPGKPRLLRLGRRWVRLLGDPGVASPTKSSAPVRISAGEGTSGS
jgi:tyrosyl-tRNA synthetase